MNRSIVTIDEHSVIVTGNKIWMTAWEIAELFNVTSSAVNNAIKAIRKSDVLNTYHAHLFHRWPMEKAVAKGKTDRLHGIRAARERRLLLKVFLH